MKIYFLEFAVAPYESVTKSNIEESSGYRLWFYGRHEFIKEIQSMLENTKSDDAIDNTTIRLKVVIVDKDHDITYYVDRNGTVLREDTGASYSLGKEGKKTVEKAIFRFRGVVDQRPEVDLWGECQK